jgi:hypothetical protein
LKLSKRTPSEFKAEERRNREEKKKKKKKKETKKNGEADCVFMASKEETASPEREREGQEVEEERVKEETAHATQNQTSLFPALCKICSFINTIINAFCFSFRLK